MKNINFKFKIKPKCFAFTTKVLSIVLLFALYALNLSTACALTMSNDDYILQMENLNTTGGQATGTNYKLNTSVGQTAPGLYSSGSYQVKIGFQYVKSIIPFRFTISDTLIDFGPLSPTNPITRTNELTVSNNSAFGYSVIAFENHSLTTSGGAVIPDTTCDNGKCNEAIPDTWISVLTYGFGYRCDNLNGTDCSLDFENADNYKQFANLANSKTPVEVMHGTISGLNKAQITYKVNVSGNQTPGLYENSITYIATPTY